ncbi:DUF4249 domain-containing protein [Fibrella forsythiae]|uniref:DUF4249 domain-containing protein n=1 Tax=Fibrella forsythiae TaxID=2817061 RepID=A0ABS3JQV1_9BACT|nr:DUF4249 domain-containing protein [Fibrella forsythiae]MBO0952373.1 DUF4249 domain-containing protein [Fibrella forsythiae]
MSLRRVLLSSLMALLLGCVSSYDPDLVLNSSLVVVSGMITDLPETQVITLNRSRSNRDSANVSTAITNARVEVIVNGGETVLLSETVPGTYHFPDTFRGQVGSRYRLRFRTAEGAQYESSEETMAAVPAVSKAYDQFTLRGPRQTADGTPIPANDVYIDFTDPGNTRNFYLWRWRLYELQNWCATCKQGRYIVRDIGPIGSGPIEVIGCVPDPSLAVSNLFDYTCRSTCWDIFYSSDINVFSDIYANGQNQVGRKIASIPIYQRDPALIVIEQLSISADAYRYYKLFADQVQNTGTLADAPPAPIAGNVKNLADPTENVVGYFSVSSVAVNRYKMDRKNATTGNYRGLFFAQNGRNPNVEVLSGQFGAGVPSAICVPGRYRTDQLPPGWNQ